MKTTYESFAELADAMTDGEGMLHSFNCPANEKENPRSDWCIPWQCGVHDFAGWLDHIGAKVEITDGAESFYQYARDRGTIKLSD